MKRAAEKWLLGSCGLERLGLQLAVLLQKNFYLAFCFFELFATVIRELHSFFEQFESLFESDIPTLQLIDDFFQPLQAIFKLRQGLLVPKRNCTANPEMLMLWKRYQYRKNLKVEPTGTSVFGTMSAAAEFLLGAGRNASSPEDLQDVYGCAVLTERGTDLGALYYAA